VALGGGTGSTDTVIFRLELFALIPDPLPTPTGCDTLLPYTALRVAKLNASKNVFVREGRGKHTKTSDNALKI